MCDRILVAYASKYGGTVGIAEKIGQVLCELGLNVDVLPVSSVHDLTSYDVVILGSAVYIGQWRKEAVKFLKNNQEMLSKRQVWLFSSGPTGEGTASDLTKGWCFPEALRPIVDRIQPCDIALFHGVTNMAKLNPIEKWMLKNVQASLGDFRNWDGITTWAGAIATKLTEKESVPEMQVQH